MKKLFLLFILAVLFGYSNVNAQVTAEPYMVSTGAAVLNADDIFVNPYNGLTNVGKESTMYFKGSATAGLSGSQMWTLLSKPTGSTAAFGAKVEVEGFEVIIFIPDLVGNYMVEFSDAGAMDTISLHAGTYAGGANCAMCHSGVASKWEGTGHASTLDDYFDGKQYLRSTCADCHATGYDLTANNDGFDDFDFVYPDTLFDGQSANLAAAYPGAMARSNVQCEACHGPSANHLMDGFSPSVSSGADACLPCHDNGHYHILGEAWSYAGHAAPPARDSWSGSCAKCHTTTGFIQFAKGETVNSGPTDGINCAACHDPHDATNPNQIRVMTASLANGYEIEVGGKGKLCMNCHQNRRDSEEYAPTSGGSHFGPHYMPQADMLVGQNAVTFGQTLPSSAHAAGIENSCIECHMSPNKDAGGHNTSKDADGNPLYTGGHTFNVSHEGSADNVKVCEPCHGSVGDSFDVKKFYMNGMADHDGDGTEEGLQEEVHGLMDKLAAMLPHADSVAGYDAHDSVTDDFTAVERQAAFNFELVYYDHSYGIHNPAFTVSLLKTSMEALELSDLGPGVLQSVMDVPNDQGKQVTVSWTQFMGDGVSDNMVTSYVVLREDGADWTEVGTATPIKMMKYSVVVPTLYDSTADGMMTSKFKVVAKYADGTTMATDMMEGFSIDNLIPMAPANVNALLADNTVELTWDDPVDADFEYFAVYRSTTEAFAPNTENMIGTTVSPEFNDPNLEENTYYYKVAAYDFSGNMGEVSDEVYMSVTGIDGLEGLPTEYSLFQNYPNPFNPSTQIKFALPQAGEVKVKVYDAVGREVATIVNQALSAGYHTYTWNATNNASGIYFYEIQVNSFVQVNKMLLIK
ncbi:MAG: T9SS type A sorting domain-containing protein [Melioribacteraceae bacterium]|nr:T9SS type A sorting domain-containing protein [Melioribacteraceae bacterium]